MNPRYCTALVLAATLASTTAFAAPQFKPNSQRYAEKNPSAATGRSGSATLAARALLGKDGSTVVDVTTGVIDSTAKAPGYISKVQFKAYRADETVAFTKNFAGTTPTQQFTFTDLARGQGVQVQGNVRGIDGKRTDVVTVSETVRRRPDLGVGLSVPSKAKVNTVVSIAASIVEANGDAGATADCVLFVDGVEADRSNGIWVDSGDTVSCAFNHTFTATGTHTVKVEAANVVPGDWDTTNNSASASIEIVSAETKLNYWFQAGENKHVNKHHSYGNYKYTDGTYSQNHDWEYLYNYEATNCYVYISTWSNSAFGFPLTMTAQESSDGVAGVNNTIAIEVPDWGYTDAAGTYGCASRYSDGMWLHMCSYDWYGSKYSYSYYQRYSGKVTYFSKNWSYYWDSNGNTNSWGYNDPGYSYTNGQPSTFGNTVKLDYKIDAANGTFTAAPEVTLSSWDYYWWYYYYYNQPLTCYDYSDSYYSQHSCYSQEYSYVNRYGYAQDYSNP